MNDFALSLLLLGALSTGNQLPFWATTNQSGLMPEGSGGLALLQAGTQYDTSKDFQWKWGVSLAGNVDTRPLASAGNDVVHTADFSAMVDELYGSVRWKALSLDLGMKRFDRDFYGAGLQTLGSMSATGGNVIWSGNARTMPGYLLTLDPVPVPLTRKILWFHGAFGDFKTLDNRYVKGALVHRTKLFALFKITPRLDFQIGVDHVAVWGGTHPTHGTMPVTLRNYVRMFLGQSGEWSNDVNNTIGNQLGREVFRLDWRGNGWKLALQHDIPYEDRSGILMENFPDGINTLWFGFDDKDRWVSDILYEYHYTMWQSGTVHDKYSTPPQRGVDNYFINGDYRSGWTYYGRTVGDPLLVPTGTRAGTWTGKNLVLGVENNRLKAHHFSLAGKAFRKFPYKLMLTYSQNYGRYATPYTGESQFKKPWGTVKETPLHQVSAAFVGEIPLGAAGFVGADSALKHFTLTYGLFADRGQLLPDLFGGTLGLRWDL